ncbi:hypothetical protein MNBD_ALPHA11-1500 [hydrothermal vent metagenome]|uniref:Co-chaperone DjlA N-terminal domain-containing protein n=1 Tax=hydrothermal vent metagenome TaxID=652676 RepID=A0A3B0TUM9_9ZZZZ
MFKAISDLLNNSKKPPNQPIDTKLAVAVLLVHLSDIDGETTDEEQKLVALILKEHFDLNLEQVDELIKSAHSKDQEAVDFYQFTSIITQLDMEQRIKIISMMWQVVFADKKNHELEDNMIWRVAELIGVSSRDRTKLRAQFAKKALE